MSVPDSLTFVLVPDAEFARGLRRNLAETLGPSFVRVGTWPDLLDRCAHLFSIAPPTTVSATWQQAVDEVEDAFWAGSLAVDPTGVAAQLRAGWRQLVCSLPPDVQFPAANANPRIAKRADDLDRLGRHPGFDWPDDLRIIQDILRSKLGPIKPIRVLASRHFPPAGPWERALLSRLDSDCPAASDALSEAMAGYDQAITSPRAQHGSTLHAIQSHLFTTERRAATTDASFRIAGVRDALESVEVALSIIQQRVLDEPDFDYADCGILLSAGSESESHLSRLSRNYGIPIANEVRSVAVPDHGAELVRFALMAWSELIPITAAKSMLSNPLLPWDAETGRALVAALDDRRFGLNFPRSIGQSHRALASFLLSRIDIDRVGESLTQLLRKLDESPAREAGRCAAADAVDRVVLRHAAGGAGWDDLIAAASSTGRRERIAEPVYQEGVTVYREGQTPWRPVRMLLVLDFADGHFPSTPDLPQVLSTAEWTQLASEGLEIELPRDAADRARVILRQQFGQASESVVVFVARRDALGQRMEPSATLYDIAALFGRADEAASMIDEMETRTGRDALPVLPLQTGVERRTPNVVQAVDLELGRNLLKLRSGEDEEPKPLSPSAMDKILVSPTAWLLAQLGAEARLWEPERFDPGMTGSAAHSVFESLFPAGERPSELAIDESVRTLLLGALRQLSPYLMAPQFSIEREHLIGQVHRAARRWRAILEQLEAEVVQPELWLMGRWQGLPVHGQADAVIDIPGVGLAIVDYKNSSHKKYFQRMVSGMDLQASMYRTMLETGEPKPRHGQAIELPTGRALAGVLYFTLRDQTVSADFQPGLSVGSWRTADNEVSEQAMRLLSTRVAEVQQGKVRAPRRSELDVWEKQGVPLYAVSASPLAGRLVLNDLEDES